MSVQFIWRLCPPATLQSSHWYFEGELQHCMSTKRRRICSSIFSQLGFAFVNLLQVSWWTWNSTRCSIHFICRRINPVALGGLSHILQLSTFTFTFLTNSICRTDDMVARGHPGRHRGRAQHLIWLCAAWRRGQGRWDFPPSFLVQHVNQVSTWYLCNLFSLQTIFSNFHNFPHVFFMQCFWS